MSQILLLDRLLAGILIGVSVWWLGTLYHRCGVWIAAGTTRRVLRAILVALAVDVSLSALILFLGADGTQDGIAYFDVRLRNLAASVACVAGGIIGWPVGRLARPTRRRT